MNEANITEQIQPEISLVSPNSSVSENNRTIDETGSASSKLKGLGVALTTATLVGGVCLHFLGQTSHTTYLNTWGVDPGLFPKALDWYSVNGYYALTDRTVNLASTIMNDGRVLVILAGCILSIILYIRLLNYISKKSKASKSVNWFNNLPSWIQRRLTDIGITVLSTSLIPMILIWIGVLLAIPGLIGGSRGKAAADKERQEFSKGCENAKLSVRCIELKKNEKVVMKGFLIDSSQTHIALYDINLQKVRTMERVGLEMLAE